MQSFRQYRQLGRRIRDQLDKEQRKTTAIQGSESTKRSQAPEPDNHHGDGFNDPEKGDTSSITTPEAEEESEFVEARDLAPTQQPLCAKESLQSEPEESENALGASMSRLSTRSQRTIGTRLGLSLTGINVRDRTTNEGGEQDRQVFVVNFQGPDDPCNPHNWSKLTRIRATVLVACIGAIVGIASSIDSLILSNAAEEFHVSEIVESMATGLFLFGFGCGALFAGPFSETIGRNPTYIVTLALCEWTGESMDGCRTSD